MAVAVTNSEIEGELHARNYFAVPSGQTVPPQNNTIPSTSEEQHFSLNNKVLLLVVFGVMVVLFE